MEAGAFPGRASTRTAPQEPASALPNAIASCATPSYREILLSREQCAQTSAPIESPLTWSLGHLKKALHTLRKRRRLYSSVWRDVNRKVACSCTSDDTKPIIPIGRQDLAETTRVA